MLVIIIDFINLFKRDKKESLFIWQISLLLNVLIVLMPLSSGCKPELSMMYAGTRNILQKELGITKVTQ